MISHNPYSELCMPWLLLIILPYPTLLSLSHFTSSCTSLLSISEVTGLVYTWLSSYLCSLCLCCPKRSLLIIQRRQWRPTPVLLPGEAQWTEEPGGLQSMGSLRVGHDWATSLSVFTFHFHALEKEMATHPSVLAWRIPGTGEPGGLPSMGSHRVGHDWNDLATIKQ